MPRWTRTWSSTTPTDAGRRIQEFVDRLSNLVRAPEPQAFLEERRGLRQAVWLRHALYLPCPPFASSWRHSPPSSPTRCTKNLVRSVEPDAPESVHLAAFPQVSAQPVDQELMDATPTGHAGFQHGQGRQIQGWNQGAPTSGWRPGAVCTSRRGPMAAQGGRPDSGRT